MVIGALAYLLISATRESGQVVLDPVDGDNGPRRVARPRSTDNEQSVTQDHLVRSASPKIIQLIVMARRRDEVVRDASVSFEADDRIWNLERTSDSGVVDCPGNVAEWLGADARADFRFSVELPDDLGGGVVFSKSLEPGPNQTTLRLIVDVYAELVVHARLGSGVLPNPKKPRRARLWIAASPDLDDSIYRDDPDLAEKAQRVKARISTRRFPDEYRRELRHLGLLDRDVEMRESFVITASPKSVLVPYEGPVYVCAGMSGNSPDAGRHVPVKHIVSLHRGQATAVDLVFRRMPKVSGLLVNDAGVPLSDVVVRISSRSFFADDELAPIVGQKEQGDFGATLARIPGEPASIIFTARTKTKFDGTFSCEMICTDSVAAYVFDDVRGNGIAIRHTGSREADIDNLVVRLSTATTEIGRVVQSDGRPWDEFGFRIIDYGGESDMNLPYPYVTSDKDGRMFANFLRQGAEYWLIPTGRRDLRQRFVYHGKPIDFTIDR